MKLSQHLICAVDEENSLVFRFLHVYKFTQEVSPENRIETIATKCCHESHDNHKEPVRITLFTLITC